jgi:two-component system CheB/CheR fusion protein
METVKTRGLAGEYLLRRKDGTERWIETRSSGLYLGGQFYIVTVGQDITDRLRLERQILEISDSEQARIGQDIHDGLCQRLISLAFDVNSLGQSLGERQDPSAASSAHTIADLLDETITESRRVARGLYPVRLETEGLVSALKELANTTTERFGIDCSCNASAGEVPCDTASATHLYRIAQEAVSNAVKHSQCGKISIQITDEKGEIQLAVSDDGKGIARNGASVESPAQGSGMGMYIMEYRARSLGGSLRVLPGGDIGTTVLCRVPHTN